jgi:CubicO group peptidase (beta-lactamase class C family)
VCGGAGLFSTLEDYSRFARMLLNGGCLDGAEILTPFSVGQMSENQEIVTPMGIAKNPFGLGVRVCGETTERQPLPEGAFGWSGAFGTHFWVDPENRIAAVYLMNLANGGGSDEEASREFEFDVMSAFGDI